MAYLRIVEYPAEPNLPDNAVELWEQSVGQYLRSAPCTRAVLATDGERMTVVTEWESAAALEATMASEEYQAIVAKLGEQFGVGPQPEPTHHFEGDVRTSI